MILKLAKKYAKKYWIDKQDLAEIEKLSNDPLNANLHLEYAVYCSRRNRPYIAFSELKTAEHLGASPEEVGNLKQKLLAAIPDPQLMSHNKYFRFASLARELNEKSLTGKISVLDVGGGMGELASFIPDYSYCLAEPSVNGISGTNLPFSDQSFDYTVSCHVLEHIPIESRQLFLDQLMSKSKYGLILLNPFHLDGSSVEDRLKLVIDITDADWAKEHLDCSLPRLGDLEEYAKLKGLDISTKPNGTMTTSLAFVFIEYFSKRKSDTVDKEKLNKFFNMEFESGILDSKEWPNSYIVCLSRPEK